MSGSGKDPAAIREMFDSIAARYDLMNRLITYGRDRAWRRHLVRAAAPTPGGRLLDLGAGTGDVAAEALRQQPELSLVVAADLSEPMLRAGARRPGAGPIRRCLADALELPFADASFDAVTSAYLARNVSDVGQMFREQARVVRPGGRVVCLDTTPPPGGALAPLLALQLRVVIPLLGRLVSGNAAAYRYLPSSTRAFLDPEALAGQMREAGLVEVHHRTFMLGTQALHVGRRPSRPARVAESAP